MVHNIGNNTVGYFPEFRLNYHTYILGYNMNMCKGCLKPGRYIVKNPICHINTLEYHYFICALAMNIPHAFVWLFNDRIIFFYKKPSNAGPTSPREDFI